MEVADEVVGPDLAARTHGNGTSLVLSPHPLTLAGRTITLAELLPGETLAAYLLRHEVDLDRGDWLVCVGGAAVPREMWSRTRPHHGQVVECRRMAGRDVVRLALFVALAVATQGLSVYWGGGFWATFAAASIFVAGSYVINRILPPSSAKLRSYESRTGSNTYSLSGGRNRARPYEPLGLLFGTTKVVPDYAALPYTWFESETQILSTRFSAGVNTASVASLKIGATAIESYADVVVQKVGFPSGNTELIDWANVDTVAGGLLDAPTAPGAWVTRTSSAASNQLALDITAQLYSMADSGAMNSASLTLNVELRALPSGSWVAQADITVTSLSTAPVRLTRNYTLTPAGQYEVRMRKATVNVATTRAANAVEWVALKSYQNDVTDFDDYPQVGLRMRATGQLNGVLDELNWVATSNAVPVWNGTAWATQATRNPGAHMLAFMRGLSDSAGRLQAGMGLPDAQIDIDSLKAFMVHCTAQGYVFDDWLDEPTGCLEYLDAMAVAGLGSVSRHTGKLGVVWLASGQPIEAVVNMATMKPGSFSVEYATRALAEELEVSWFERTANYAPKSLRLLAPGITTPRETARLSPRGVTTEAGAVRMARLAMAQNIYGRKLVSWDADLEHLAYRRYSLVALSHDLTQWGYGGRVQAAVDAAGTVTLTLDEAVPANATRYIGLRIPGETGYRVFGVVAFAGTTRSVVLTSAWPGGLPLPGNSPANPAYDTIWIYDFKAEPGLRLRVTSVEPNADMKGARVTAVPEPDEFWTFMASGAYTASATPAAAAPVVASALRVTQRRLDLNFTNNAELNLLFAVSGPFDSAEVWGAPQGTELKLLGQTRLPRAGPFVVGNDGIFTLQVRPFDQLGRLGTVASLDYDVDLGDLLGADDGLCVYQIEIFLQAATVPATPSGGSYTFTGDVFVAPAGGWTREMPNSSLVPIWRSTFLAVTRTPDVPVVVPGGGSALLLHFNGTNGSTTFTDSSVNAMVPTLHGSPTLTTAAGQKVFGSAGGNFSASANTYIRFAAHASLRLPLKFTIRFRYIPSATGRTSKYFFGMSNGTHHIWFTVNGVGKLECFAFGSQTASTVSPVAGTAYYLSLTRDASGVLRWYIDTAQQPLLSASTQIFTSDPWCEIGATPSLAGGGTGDQPYIDELQILPGVCAHSGATITVPTAEFFDEPGWSSPPTKVAVDGAGGETGVVVFAYQRSSSGTPSLPSAVATYTFATKTLTGLNNGWSATIPTGTGPLYITAATARSADATDVIAASEWSAAQLFAASGLNSAPVLLYKRTASSTAPATVSSDVTYTFATGVASGLTNGWTQQLPTTGGGWRWVINATALGAGATDTLPPGEFSAVALLSEDGVDGGDAYVLRLTSDNVTLPADSTGFVISYSAAQATASVIKGGTVDDTNNWTITRTDGANISSTLTDESIQVTSLTADLGVVTVTAARTGFVSLVSKMKVSRARSAGTTSGVLSGGQYESRDVIAAIGTKRAAVALLTNGRVSERGTEIGNWFGPTTISIGTSYWVRAVARSGSATLTSGAVGSWVQLTSGIEWVLENTLETTAQSAVLDCDIAASSGGTVLGTFIVRLEAGGYDPFGGGGA